MMRESVVHYTSGRLAWQIGIGGFFIRRRGFVFTGSVTLLVALVALAAPFFWPTGLPLTIAVDIRCGLVLGTTSIGILTILAFNYLRHKTIQSLNIKYYLHQLSHNLRNYQTQIYNFRDNCIADGHKPQIDFQNFMGNVCDQIRDYFVEFTGDETLAIAIRLAIAKPHGAGVDQISYHTVARSKNLSDRRSVTSEGVKANEGIPRFLIEHAKGEGVLIFNDLNAASQAGVYKMTLNDNKYPNDIATMAVAPLNGWDGNKQSMLGILYVSSGRKSVFSVKDIDLVRFTADTIASSISLVFDSLIKLQAQCGETRSVI